MIELRIGKYAAVFAGATCYLVTACGDSEPKKPRPGPSSAGRGGAGASGSGGTAAAGKAGSGASAGSTSGGSGGDETSGGHGGSAGGEATGGNAGSGEAGAGADSGGDGGAAGGAPNGGGLGADCDRDDDCSEGRSCYGDFGCAVVCEQESTELMTAEEVSQFAARACEVLSGSLRIHGSALTNVDGLESGSLRVVSGDLTLGESSALENVRGLRNLQRIGGSLVIQANEELRTLEGLEGLERLGSNSVSNTIVLASNPLLESVAALGNVSRILAGLVVTSNAALPSLTGIDSMRATSNVLVANNAALTQLGGLQALEAVGMVTIASNQAITSVQLPALETAETLAFTGLSQLTTISLPQLTTISASLTIAANPLLGTLGATDGWLAVESMTITDNASLPQCEVDLLDARLMACAGTCAMNDASATCD
jgi:hypothetical protein